LYEIVYNVGRGIEYELEDRYMSASGPAQWYTVEQVAQQLQINPETVRRAIRQKRLKAVKFKGWRISPQALQEYLDEISKRPAA